MSLPGAREPQRILFLDDDPAVRLARAMTLRALPEDLREWLPGYLWPEQLPEPGAYLATLRTRTRLPDDAVGIHRAAPATLSEDERRSVTAVVFRRGSVDRALLDLLPALRVVQRFASNAPDVDVETAARLNARDIALCVFPRTGVVSVAEHAMTLLLAARRRLRELDVLTRSGTTARTDRPDLGPVTYNWTRFADVPLLRGSNAGIIGLGDIGVEVAKLLLAFGAQVHYCNRNRLSEARERELGVRYLPLPALLEGMDSVILTATPAADAAPIIGAGQLASMRPTAVLVNVARGSLIDEAALAGALASKRIAGAGLDVYAHEPLPATSPLNCLPNVILTPHLAGQSRMRLFVEVSELLANVATALRGEAPRHRVDPVRT